MPSKIDVSLLKPMLESGRTFELTQDEYKRIIGRALPSTDDYLKYKSPVAKAAREEGYRIRVEERLIAHRILIFEKEIV